MTELELEANQLTNLMILWQVRLSDGSWLTCSEETYNLNKSMGWAVRKLKVQPVVILEEIYKKQTTKD